MPERLIDHLVYATKNFEESLAWFENISGVKPVFGGYHKSQGTKNALVWIGEGIYLEILGIDENNHRVTSNRWMGVDEIQGAQLTRWAWKSEDLASDAAVLKDHNKEMGQVAAGSRETQEGKQLSWEMLLPLAVPAVDICPFMIKWGKAEHPCSSLQKSCELQAVKLYHPDPEKMNKLFKNLGMKLSISTATKPCIKAVIQTPAGEIEI